MSRTYSMIGCWLLLTSWAFGQENWTVPIAIYIENAYTLEPQAGVDVVLHVKQPNGLTYRYGAYTSDAEGMVPLSVVPNTVYQISSRKAEYYSQLTLLETNELSRTGNNRFNISLRPKSCYRLQGQLQQAVGEESYIVLRNATSGEQQRVRILSDGRYYACGECGATYYLDAQLDGVAQQPDTIYLDPVACQTQRSPILNLAFQPHPLPPLDTPEIAPPPLPTMIPPLGDSLVVENLVFEGKTKRLDQGSEAVLEELIEALAQDSSLVVELLVHTDSRKSERYNWLLAERRGELLREYLENNGIDPRRYRILPIGEQKILNHCTNGTACSAVEHRQNNRVELVRHPNGKLFIKE